MDSVMEKEARLVVQAPETEQLRRAYEELFPCAAAPVDRLPELFAAAGLAASQQQVDTAIAVIYPAVVAAGVIPYNECQEVFLHLQQLQPRASVPGPDLAHPAALSRWMAGLSDSNAANLLLGVVVALCCLSAFLAGGLAILLLVLDDTRSTEAALQENLHVVQDTLEVYAGQIAMQQQSQRAAMFVATLASVLQSVVFATKLNATMAQLSHMLVSVAQIFGAWLTSEPSAAFRDAAWFAARLANATVARYGLSGAAALFDEVNAGLPAGYELLLGRWRVNTTAVELLTRLRQCLNRRCAVDDTVAAPIRAALSGNVSVGWGTDYRGATIYAGASSANGVAAQLAVLNTTLAFARFAEGRGFLEAWTNDPSNALEYTVAYMPSPGVRQLAYSPPGCDAVCRRRLLANGMPLTRALNGEAGTMTYRSTRWSRAVAAYSPVPNAPWVGLAIQLSYADIVQSTLQAATSVVDSLNTNFPSRSEEFELTAYASQGNATNFSRLTAHKFGGQCPAAQCVEETDYLQQAAANCSAGVLRTTDYRGRPVLASYKCIRRLNAILSFKVDMDDIDSDTMAVVQTAVERYNAGAAGTSAEFLVARPRTQTARGRQTSPSGPCRTTRTSSTPMTTAGWTCWPLRPAAPPSVTGSGSP
eukprot:EG_transcript_1724